jgi:hypothetical protein
MPWLLVVGGQEQGSSYASGMKEAAGLKSNSFPHPAALLLTADHQQPRHHTPYSAITQV